MSSSIPAHTPSFVAAYLTLSGLSFDAAAIGSGLACFQIGTQ